mmetsp:Transcript_2709/g.6082  ORF Transcript_2709/g.6082 Transcript_2709/m.6082 type:complete len:175 (-) Transcript_2709:206-730(-)|eukprot:CAMPEP_0197588606 /NCGR_PEP_ID=MMETSP1326-20131121/9831_1 /TAXON_ID=1155430 /ORGANISM="Genus nov. species nov., Strain RCC2288" /LENGTH=174 /DNA_ID=CAMNT_0043153449 /DNA_START=101 /DNA_END=625 /DNA_ORIENTATION=-
MATPGDSHAAALGTGTDTAVKAKKPPKIPKKAPKTPAGRGGKGGRGGTAADKKGKAPAEEVEELKPQGKDVHKRKRGMMGRENMRYMMYGFGDGEEPSQETTDLVEDVLVDYITNFANRALEVSARRGRMQTEDMLYLIRNDDKKLLRVNELLDMNVQLKDARKNFDLDEGGNA